jgi:hypothetical protein
MDLIEKLTVLSTRPNTTRPVPPAGWTEPPGPALSARPRPRAAANFFGRRALRQPAEGALYQRIVYDCQYCVNRRSNDVPRAAFTPRELAELTIAFYRRNYIEGLFLSSAVAVSPDRTTELMIEALRLLREEFGFRGYIHAKAIPGADPLLTRRLGFLADRLSVNIERPSRRG